MKADFITPKCCDRSSIAVMDYLWPIFTRDEEIQSQHVNRMCMKCHMHWAGPVDSVRQFTGKEWDRHVEQNA